MPSQNQQFIYTFNESENKFIALNTRTGQRVDDLHEDVRHLLEYFKAQQYDYELRKFVLWCARQTNSHIKAVQHKFFQVAISEISGKECEKQMERIYQQTEREAIAMDTIGSTQRSSQAAAFLISRECVNPKIDEAAINAARFYILWSKLRSDKVKNPTATTGYGIHPCFKKAATRQVNQLLDLLKV